jgi:uncharacterized protein YuzE
MPKKNFVVLLLIFVSPLFAADFTLGRYASPDGPIDSLPPYPGLMFTNYFEFREGGVMLMSATMMEQTYVAAATYKIEGTIIIVTDSEGKIIVFDIQKDGSLICRTWPWEDVVLKRVG